MNDYTKLIKSEEGKIVIIWFYNEKPKPLAIGKKMNDLNDLAYMNGYNWHAFLDFYLTKHHPDLLEDLEPDPEGGSYWASYPLSKQNEEKGEKFIAVITDLIENEEKIYEILRKEGSNIDWD